MALCPKCEVELENGIDICPLCRTRIHEDENDKPLQKNNYPNLVIDAENKEKLTPKEIRKVFAEIITISAFLACIITLFVNLFVQHEVTWSRYTLTSTIYVWMILYFSIILIKKPWIILAILGPVSILFVFLIAVYSGDLKWFLFFALPITLLFEAVMVSIIVLTTVPKKKGLNVIGTILFGITFFLIGLEMIIDLNMGGIDLTWSLIVAFATIPIAAFCFYLHYRIVKQASLRKLFRI